MARRWLSKWILAECLLRRLLNSRDASEGSGLKHYAINENTQHIQTRRFEPTVT